MNGVLWTLQIVLALLYVAGGAYKTFMFDDLAGAMVDMPRGGWRALGMVEMLGGLLLVLPLALGWMPLLTGLAAAVLTVETLGLVVFYARYSVALTPANPLVWAVIMALLAGVVTWGRLRSA